MNDVCKISSYYDFKRVSANSTKRKNKELLKTIKAQEETDPSSSETVD